MAEADRQIFDNVAISIMFQQVCQKRELPSSRTYSPPLLLTPSKHPTKATESDNLDLCRSCPSRSVF